MTSKPNFWSNCGQKLDTGINECSRCHIRFQELSRVEDTKPSVVQQLPHKSPGTAALIAFLGGLIALRGIGHIYVGKLGKGIAILICGILLATLLDVLTYSVGVNTGITQSESFTGILAPVVIAAVFGIAYIVLFIWQIFDARKLAKKFNESIRVTGKEPW